MGHAGHTRPARHARPGVGRRVNLRDALIASQVALSLVALVCAGLFIRSLQTVQQIDPGFDPTRLGMVRFDLGAQGYGEAQGREFQRRAIEAAQRVPGINSITLSTNVPLFGGTAIARSVFPEGEEGTSTRTGIVNSWSLPWMENIP